MIYVIGDTQVKPGVRNPLRCIAHHICAVKPKHVIHLGDHWDMPSLSAWDKGKRRHSVTASYLKDMDSGNFAMQEFWSIIKHKWPEYYDECTWVILQGNHEERRARALDRCDWEYVDLIKSIDFDYSNWDMVVPFLEVAKIHGIEFSHYFQNTGSSRPIGSARNLLNKRHVTCIAGHQQGFDYAEMLQGKDKTIQAIIMGSSYFHLEGYLNHNNHHFRGTLVLSNLKGNDGFDFARFSMSMLGEWYGV